MSIPHLSDFQRLNTLWLEYYDNKNTEGELEKLSEFLKYIISSSIARNKFTGSTPIINELAEVFIDKTTELYKENDDGISLYKFFLSKVGIQLLIVIEQMTKLSLEIDNHSKIIELCCLYALKIMNLPANYMSSNDDKIPQDLSPFIKIVFSPLKNLCDEPENELLSIDLNYTPSDDFTQIGAYDEASTGCICCYLLLIIGNIFQYQQYEPRQDLRDKVLFKLLELLSIRHRTINYGILTVHRQLMRTLWIIISRIYEIDSKLFLECVNNELIDLLVNALSDPQNVSSVYTVELTQIIINILRISHKYSDKIVIYFNNCGGLTTISNNIIYLSDKISKNQHKELLLIFCKILNCIDTNNPEFYLFLKGFYNSLLIIYTQTSSVEVKSNILKIIYQLIKQNKTISENFKPGMLRTLYFNFDVMNLYNRYQVLKIMKHVVSRAGILEDDLYIYTEALKYGKSSTILLISKHLSNLIKNKKISRSKLREAGIGNHLMKYICLPSSHFLKDILENNPEELRCCLSVTSDTVESVLDAERLKQVPKTENEIELVDEVLYALVIRVLDLTYYYLMENTFGQEDFRASDLSSLFKIIEDDKLREYALKIFNIIVVGDILCESSIINNLLSFLNRNYESFASIQHETSYLKDIISTINNIMIENSNTKNIFRECKGMELTISNLYIKRFENMTHDEILDLQKEIIQVIGTSMRGNEINQEYFMKNKLKDLVFESLIQSKVINNISSRQKLCEILLENSLSLSYSQLKIFNTTKSTDQTSNTQPSFEDMVKYISNFNTTNNNIYIENTCYVAIVLEILAHNLKTNENSQIEEDHFLHILSSLIILIESSPLNYEKLCRDSMPLFILSIMKPIILRERYFNNPLIQQRIMDILEKLNSFSINIQDFRKYLEMLRSPNCPLNVIETLASISSSNFTPVHSLRFSKKDSSLKISSNLLSNVLWPPKKGYSLSMWFQYDASHSLSLINLFSMMISKKNYNNSLVVSLDNNGILRFYLNDNNNITETQIKDIIFEKNRWYHLILSFIPGIDSNNSSIVIYVDGIKLKEISFPYFTGRSRCQFSCSFGGSNSRSVHDNFLDPSWSLGNSFLLRYRINREDALKIFLLGPNYIGKLDKIYDEKFKSPDILTHPYIEAFPNYDILLNPNVLSLSSLNEKIIFFFSAKDKVFCVKNDESNASITKNVIHVTRFNIGNIINYVGGISLLLYYLATCFNEKQFKCTLTIIVNVLKWNPYNFKEMSSLGGYGIISRILRKIEWTIDEEILSIIFCMVGFSKSKKVLSYSDGVLQNMEAFETLLLDWKIWHRAPDSIRLLLVKSISDSLTLSQCSKFNIYRMRKSKIKRSLIRLLEDETFPNHIAQHIVTTISYLMNDPWSESDIHFIVRFLISTHSLPKDNELLCPFHVQHLNIEFRKIECSPKPTFKLISKVSSNVQDRSTFALDVRVQGEESEAKPIRDLILTMILDKLNSSKPDFISTFFNICTEEILLTLLQTSAESTQALILSLIEKCLKIKTFELKFRKQGGYILLGEILRQYNANEDIFSSLFTMLLKTSVNFSSLFKNGIGYYLKPNTIFDSNDTVIPIILMISSCHLSPQMKHLLIKTLHDGFLQSESLKSILIQSNIVRYLCHIFVPELDHRVGRTLEMDLKSSQYQKNESPYCIEEDVLSFLKSIILHGLETSTQLLRETLASIHILPIPHLYSISLQKRVIYDTFEFYVSSTFNNPTTVYTFQKIVTFCINIIMFLNRTTSSGKFRVSKIKQIRHTYPSLNDEDSKSEIEKQTTTESFSQSLKSQFFELLQSSEDYDPIGEEQKNLNIPEFHNSFMNEEEEFEYSPKIIEEVESIQESLKLGSISNRDDEDSSNEEEEIGMYHSQNMSEISMRAWINNDYLIKDQELISLTFKIFKKYLSYKEKQSTFKRLSEVLRHKMVGVSTLENVSTNVSWYLERLIHHYVLEMDFDTETLKIIFDNIQDINLSSAFSSETEFSARFLMYTSKLLNNPDISLQCLNCRKKIIENMPTKVLKRIFVDYKNISIDNINENLKFTISIKDRIKKIEYIDKALRSQFEISWNKRLKEAESVTSMIDSLLQNLISKCSISFNEILDEMKDPLLSYERRILEEEKKIRTSWKRLIKRVTHQRGTWAIHKSLVRWVLDSTEGPFRIRQRLKPLYAHKHPIIGLNATTSENVKDPRDVYLSALDANKVKVLKALESQMNEDEVDIDIMMRDENIKAKENILFSSNCSKISPFHKRDGNLIIVETNIYFIDRHKFAHQEEELHSYTSIKKHISFKQYEIREIHKRRYLLIDSALEIFLITGKTIMLAFQNKNLRDEAYSSLIKLDLPNFINYENEMFLEGKITKMSLTQKWQKGLITNFEYLMHLNTLAGRTFNDLTQYPVFPFILRDYDSEELDIENPDSYRDLMKPMGAQDFLGTGRLLKFIEKYETLLELKEKPYFYGTHYSNIGSVLHFLVRLEPFSQYFIEFQGGKFDVPDRIFHSIKQTWNLSSHQSQSDVKELIPEFFLLPEFLVNSNKFDFGLKQDGERVDDVILPPWAKNSPRLFILKHMEALESDYVSFNLHHWIDLIFGYKQVGEAALKARNIFHPYTYQGEVDIDKITNPIERTAIITQINSYGQTPTQLFKKPHPARSPNYNAKSRQDSIFRTPEKLKAYKIMNWEGPCRIHFLFNVPIALALNQDLIWPSGTHYLQWGNWDDSMRIISFKTKNVEYEIEFPSTISDKVLCSEVSKDGRFIISGTESGLVYVWRKANKVSLKKDSSSPEMESQTLLSVNSDSLKSIQKPDYQPSQARKSQTSKPYKFSVMLDGHYDSVTCIKICTFQNIFATGSKDKSVILWDCNRLRFIRSFSDFNGKIVAIEILNYTAEIVCIDDNEDNKTSNITMYTVNGELIAKKETNNKVRALAVTNGKPGVSRNVIITGHENGEICLWSLYDLSFIMKLDSPHKTSISSFSVSEDNKSLLSSDISGEVYCLSIKPM